MKKLALAALATTAFASSAQAIEGEWYTRVGFGITTADDESVEEFLANEIETDLGITEDVDFDYPRGYNFGLGYRLSPHIAFEASYINFGEEKKGYAYSNAYGDIETIGIEGVETMRYSSKISGTAKTLGAVLSTDVGRPLSGGLRAGYAFWSTEADVIFRYQDQGMELNSEGEQESYSISYREERLKDETDGGDPFYGGFVNWRIGRWTYSLEHTLYNTEDSDLSLSSISLSMDI
ncbi:outer membrane beta-barrel protein [Microbulbifer litoralis]|uniref:outer membrane beta-barrel protein n=1 Tax=Microbulbifer litoralis TaxID=2933965 RepID=UPI0020282AE5|nr:outer membrane beta-barrel protein [Microbulbifer sp. GX H0434]